MIYVSEEWKIPALCTINFENKESMSIVLGEELNSDESIPLPIKYVDGSVFYVLKKEEMLTVELVQIILQDEFEDTEYVYEDKLPTLSTSSILLIVFVLIILILIVRTLF